jgi:hypothetical protein
VDPRVGVVILEKSVVLVPSTEQPINPVTTPEDIKSDFLLMQDKILCPE